VLFPASVLAQTKPTPAPVLPPVPDVAPGYSAPNVTPASGDLVGVTPAPFVGIKLDDAIAMALQRNTDLAVSVSNVRIANYQIVAAKSAYDVKFELQPSFTHSVSPSVSSFEAGPGGGPITQDTTGAMAGFTGQLAGGQHYTVSGTATRVLSNSTIDSYNPFFETALGLTFTQPLLRGAGVSDSKHQVQLAAANATINREAALTSASQTIADVSNTYWDLVAAWRNVGIQEEGLRQAKAQAESNERLAARGAVAPVDIVESTTQVNVFQDNVFAALASVQRLQTQLKSLILANPADPVWMANLVPTSPVLNLPAEPKLDDLIVTALKNRPEVAQLRAERIVANSNLGYAKDQLKPQLDLNLGWTSNGFAGIPTPADGNPIFATFGAQIAAINTLITRANAGQPPGNQIPLLGSAFPGPPANTNGRLGTAFGSTFNNQYPTYNISLTLQFPLGNRGAKAQYAIAEEQSKQVAIQELSLLQRIRSEAVNALQQFRETQYRLVAASNARAAAERVLLAEQRRFSVGSSTTFLILQRQLDVANEKGRELQAQTDLNKAVVELNRVAGSVFTTFDIDATKLGATTLSAAK
jgi:HAE1 family hydrophobic/amphiphilic exporter-1